MSIKIHTYYYTNNIGALLQSLSLKTFLEKEFHLKVSYSNYQPRNLIFREIYSPLITKNLFKLTRELKKNFNIRKWKKKQNLFLPTFTKEKLQINKYLNIYGSDEIWNFKNKYYDYEPYFFGNNEDSFKISYAASLGKSDFSELNEFIKKEIRNNLRTFASISVRDVNTANFVEKIINIRPQIVVDPTLLVTPNFLENSSSNRLKLKSNYALIYGTIFSLDQKKTILDFCRINNLIPISISYYNNWSKINHIDIDPTDFYQYFKNASIIFTSMFHGIMFSVKLKKNFWYSVDPIRINKIEHFVNELNIANRLLQKNINLNQIINYQQVDFILSKWILKSKNFLRESVSNYIKNYLINYKDF